MFATVGDNCIDRYLPPVGHSTVGGNAVNVAVQMAGLGHVAACFTAVGDDADGRRIRAALTAAGVDVSGLCTRDGLPTAWTDLTVDAAGERHIGYEEFGACRGYTLRDGDMRLLANARHVHLGWLDDGGHTARRLAAAGIALSVDHAVNRLVLPGMTVFAAARPEDADAVIVAAESQGAAAVVVTLGADGALAAADGKRVRSAALAARITDTLGAGDSFIAGFLSARLAGADLAACLAAGHALAAKTCGHWGGFPQRPEPF